MKIILTVISCLLFGASSCFGWSAYMGGVAAESGGYSDIIYYHNADAVGDAQKSGGSAAVSYTYIVANTSIPIVGTGSWDSEGVSWATAIIPVSGNASFTDGRVGLYVNIQTLQTPYRVLQATVETDLYVEWRPGSDIKFVFGGQSCNSASTFTPGIPYFLEFEFNGAAAALYVDGVQECTISGASEVTSTGIKIFGNNSGTLDLLVDQLISSNDHTRDINAIKDIIDFN